MADAAIPAAWPAALGRRGRYAAAFLAGALVTAGQAPVQFPWLLFVALPAIVWLTATTSHPRNAAWIGWWAGFGYFVTVFHWMGYPFLVEAEQFAFLMPVPVLIFPAFLGLFWAAALCLARCFWPGGMIRGALLVAAMLTLVEIARSFSLTGYPWALPGYVWIDLPPMQAAAWIGPFGMTLLTLVLTALPGTALTERRWGALALSLAACAGIWAAGSARLDVAPYAPDAPVVRVVQPNAPQRLKFQPGYREEFYRRTLAATAEPADPALGAPDLVLWPETAVHFLIDEHPEEAARIAEIAGDAPVVLGTIRRAPGDERDTWYNSLAVILPDGSFGPGYDKHHLVPFGEYVPYWSLLRHLGLPQFTSGPGYSPGPGPRTLTLPGLPGFSALICFEAIFPWEVVAPDGPRPEWMVQLTNDAWFGPWAGPRQHFAQSRVRAIEQGLPLVRSANTGISAIVDPYGRVIDSLPLDSYGKIDAKLPSAISRTIYSRTGDWPAIAAVVVLALTLVFMHARVVSD